MQRISRLDDAFRRAILAGYPDRVAQRREPGSPERPARVWHRRDDRLAKAASAMASSSLHSTSAAIHNRINPQSTRNPQVRQLADVRIASRVEREWLAPTASSSFTGSTRRAGRCARRSSIAMTRLVLAERPAAGRSGNRARACWPTPGSQRGPRDEDIRCCAGSRFAGHDMPTSTRWSATAAYGVATLDDVRIDRRAGAGRRARSIATRPMSLAVPSGRHQRARSITRTAASPRR